jgi:hypothetical protein
LAIALTLPKKNGGKIYLYKVFVNPNLGNDKAFG